MKTLVNTVRTLAGQLMQRITLDANGLPFDDANPETFDEAASTKPEIIQLGSIRLKVIDSDAVDLAIATGAINAGDREVCLRVWIDQADGAPEPSMGQYIVLPTDEPGVSIVFFIWTSHADLHDPAAPDLGLGAMRNEALDALEVGQALLVQVLDHSELEIPHAA